MSEAAMEEDVLYGQLEGATGGAKHICIPERASCMQLACILQLQLTGWVLLQGKLRGMESQHSSHPLQTLRTGNRMLRFR